MTLHSLYSHFFGILIAVKKSLYLRYPTVKPLGLKLNFQIVRKTFIHLVIIWYLCTLSNCTVCFRLHKRDSKRKCILMHWLVFSGSGFFFSSLIGLGSLVLVLSTLALSPHFARACFSSASTYQSKITTHTVYLNSTNHRLRAGNP